MYCCVFLQLRPTKSIHETARASVEPRITVSFSSCEFVDRRLRHKKEPTKSHKLTLTTTLSGFRNNQSTRLFPGLPKHNPGLKFANTFGVKIVTAGFVEIETSRDVNHQ